MSSDFVYDRDRLTLVTLRLPAGLWDQWEYRHQHFGKAVHALRENCIDIMAAGTASPAYIDAPDPFFRESK